MCNREVKHKRLPRAREVVDRQVWAVRNAIVIGVRVERTHRHVCFVCDTRAVFTGEHESDVICSRVVHALLGAQIGEFTVPIPQRLKPKSLCEGKFLASVPLRIV